MEDKTASEGSSFQVIILSFASQKNDMLLRNMIFRLNVEMIDSPKGEYDMFGFAKRDWFVLA